MNTWQQKLKNSSITQIEELANILGLQNFQHELLQNKDTHFPLMITQQYVSRIEKGNRYDPLLLQILPQQKEHDADFNEFTLDPLEEAQANPLPGVLHKYAGRILLTVVGTCPINCRYCFRQHFPYQQNNPRGANLVNVLDYVKNDPSISEIIYSGGEPLLANNRQLMEMSLAFAEIPHVKRLRIHSRMPIVFPDRIDDDFLMWMTDVKLAKSIVLHCNHPNEIDDEVQQAIAKLRTVATVLNQSVLLANVNDSADTLIKLSEKLFTAGALPYYLHALDKVKGSAHFAVADEKGRSLIESMRHQLPGYLVPKFVRSKSKSPSKISIA